LSHGVMSIRCLGDRLVPNRITQPAAGFPPNPDAILR